MDSKLSRPSRSCSLCSELAAVKEYHSEAAAKERLIPFSGNVTPSDSIDELQQLRAQCDRMQEAMKQFARWTDVDKEIRTIEGRINTVEANLLNMTEARQRSCESYEVDDAIKEENDPLLPTNKKVRLSEIVKEIPSDDQPSLPYNLSLSPGGRHPKTKTKISQRSLYFTIEADRTSNEADRSYALIKKNAANLFAFEDNIWSASMLVILRDVPLLREAGKQFNLILVIAACWAMNIILQLAFLFWSVNYLVLPSVRGVQDRYQAYHAEVFSKSGVLIDDAFSYFADHQDLCGLAISKQHFLSCVLFLWSATCLTEIIQTFQWIWIVKQLPDLPQGLPDRDFVAHVFPDFPKGRWSGQHHIVVCATTKYRTLILFAIFIPRLIIAILLWTIGLVWLTASEHFSSLILDSVALNFIISIDETLFQSFLPSRFREDIGGSKVAIAQKSGLAGSSGEKGAEDNHTDSTSVNYQDLPTIGIFLFAVVTVFVWVTHAQAVLPGYRFDIYAPCLKFLSNKENPWCAPFSTNCFPYGTYSAGA